MNEVRPATRINAALIGTGQAAPALAAALAKDGERVVLFEGDRLGGTCVNWGCTPTKTLRKSARIAHLARRAHHFGVHVGEVTVDFAAAMERMAGVVESSRAGLGKWMAGAEGVTLVHEWARLDGRDDEDRFVVLAGDARWLADRVYLNVGTRATMPPIAGLAAVNALANDTLLSLRTRPEHLVIIGGSYIGVEFGQIFRRLGSEVTIVEGSPTIVAREDPDVSARLTALLEGEGVRVMTGASIGEATGMSGVSVTLRGTSGADRTPFTVTGTHLLVATGRAPSTHDLGLDTVGVTCDAQGYVPVNGALETSVAGVFALGDMNRRGAFTHTSYQDHEIVLANHRGGSRSADGRITTYALYTDPPLGRVGMSEADARRAMETGRTFLSATHEMRNVSRAKEESETTGVIKVLVDAVTQRFVGATVFGIGGDEIVQTISAQMAADAPYQVLRDFLPVHPTVTELFPTILGKLAPLKNDPSSR